MTESEYKIAIKGIVYMSIPVTVEFSKKYKVVF